MARALEPLVLVGGVIDDELCYDAQSALMRFLQEVLKVSKRAIGRVNTAEIRDVVAVVLERRREEGQQP